MNLQAILTAACAGSAILITGASMTGSTSKTAPAKKLPAVVTYAEHIAPLLNSRCVECHRTGEVGPFSLNGYESAKSKSAMIAAVTQSKRMPPWKAVAGYGDFHGENRLSTEEIALLKKWNDTGVKRGDKAKEPKPPTFSGEWSLGKPDYQLVPKRAYNLEAEGDDVYRNFVIDPGFSEPTYVTAIDVKPGNTKIVHHVIAYLDERGASLKLDKENKDGQEGYSTFGTPGFIPSGALGGWAPGVRARHSAPSTGFLIKPGTKIVMQVHYHKDGKPEKDLTKLALYTAKQPVEKELSLIWMANPFFNLEPNKTNNVVKLSQKIRSDITVYTAMPHMHLLGKSMKAWVETPEKTIIPLVFVDDWDFNWQLVYALKKPMLMKKGWIIRAEAVYDNSTTNPRNPSIPPKTVTWGEQTTDEMALLVLSYSVGEQPKAAN